MITKFMNMASPMLKDMPWTLRLFFTTCVTLMIMTIAMKLLFPVTHFNYSIDNNTPKIITMTQSNPANAKLYGFGLASEETAYGGKYNAGDRTLLAFRMDEHIQYYQYFRHELPILAERMAHIDKQIMILRPHFQKYIQSVPNSMVNFALHTKVEIAKQSRFYKYRFVPPNPKGKLKKIASMATFMGRNNFAINQIHEYLDKIEDMITRERNALIRGGKSDPVSQFSLYDPYMMAIQKNYKNMMQHYSKSFNGQDTKEFPTGTRNPAPAKIAPSDYHPSASTRLEANGHVVPNEAHFQPPAPPPGATAADLTTAGPAPEAPAKPSQSKLSKLKTMADRVKDKIDFL